MSESDFARALRDEREAVPAIGSLWKRSDLRGVWKVVGVGTRFLTLRCNIASFGNHRMDKGDWPGKWERA